MNLWSIDKFIDCIKVCHGINFIPWYKFYRCDKIGGAIDFIDGMNFWSIDKFIDCINLYHGINFIDAIKLVDRFYRCINLSTGRIDRMKVMHTINLWRWWLSIDFIDRSFCHRYHRSMAPIKFVMRCRIDRYIDRIDGRINLSIDRSYRSMTCHPSVAESL